MGWCGGTDVFDSICGTLLKPGKFTPLARREVLLAVINALEDHDWDCQQDSAYYEHSDVRKVMKQLHPHWDWEDE
jgi:hypothetical protein